MPLVIYEKLGLGSMKPTRMTLQLADRLIKYPVGIVEDVHIKIRQLVIPTDFIVTDIREDTEILILLGRSFLATTGAIIDAMRGKLTLEVTHENIEFLLSKIIKALHLRTHAAYST